MTRNADEIFYFGEGPRATTKLFEGLSKSAEYQTTLEAFT
jgi:hypothetical protein